MAQSNFYAQNYLSITAEEIDLNSGTGGININGTSLAPVTGTITGAPTVDVGAITSFQTRGVGSANAVISYSAKDGIVTLRIPALQILTFTGAPTNVTLTGATLLPAAIRPLIASNNFICHLWNNGIKVAGVLCVQNTGEVQISIVTGAAFTAVFGLIQDTTVVYKI